VCFGTRTSARRYDSLRSRGDERRCSEWVAPAWATSSATFKTCSPTSSEVSGWASRRRSASQARPRRGQDVRVEAAISLKDARSAGESTSHRGAGAAPCEDCRTALGADGQPGRDLHSKCRGSGQVTASAGSLFSSPCARCRARVSRRFACKRCRGAGEVERQRKVLVAIPAGIESGQRLRGSTSGMPGPNGLRPATLRDIEVSKQIRISQASSADSRHAATITFAHAALAASWRSRCQTDTIDQSRGSAGHTTNR